MSNLKELAAEHLAIRELENQTKSRKLDLLKALEKYRGKCVVLDGEVYYVTKDPASVFRHMGALER